MSVAAVTKVSYAEFLALEAKSEVKHEYLRGEMWPRQDEGGLTGRAMAGGTPEHGRLQAGCAGELRAALVRLGRPCNVFSSDVRVRIDETDRTTYPDLFVVCGKRQVSLEDPDAITNPLVIVEVLSDSTERDDRGEKFAHYRRLPSLEEYVLVSQESRRIELFRKGPEGWVLSEVGPGQELELRSLGVRLSLDAIYYDPVSG